MGNKQSGPEKQNDKTKVNNNNNNNTNGSRDLNKIRDNLIKSDSIVNDTKDNSKGIQTAIKHVKQSREVAENAASGANYAEETAYRSANKINQHNIRGTRILKDINKKSDDANISADKAKKFASNAETHQLNAGNSSISADGSARDAAIQLNNTKKDLNQVENIINSLAYTGFNAAQINLQETKLENRLQQLGDVKKKGIELHLYNFKLEKEIYLNNLDSNTKVDTINDMFVYMVDHYTKNNIQYFKDTALTILFLDYIINNYSNNGVDTKQYKLYNQAKELKKLLTNNNNNNYNNYDKVPEPDTEGFSNISNSFNNIFNKLKNSFYSIKEGNIGMATENMRLAEDLLYQEADSITQQQQSLAQNIDYIKIFKDSEYLAQRDSIMNNILMDYMINNKEGSNIETVYEKLNQEKNNKLRKTKITGYYTKSFKEYIYLLKIIIFLIVLMIPILILNRLEIINKSFTLILVITIITLGFIYISYRLYILYIRDDKDFEKIKIPFGRNEVAKLKQGGSRYSKDSPLKSLGITCIGEECCDASMVYDKLRDKCIASENFGNYFENIQNFNNQEKNIIKQNDPNQEYHTFSYLNGNSNIINENFDNFRTRQDLKHNILIESLKKSTTDKI